VANRAGAGADFWFEAPFETLESEAAPAPLAGRTVAIVSPSDIVREAARRQVEASGGRALGMRTLDEAHALGDREAVVLVDHLLAGAADGTVAPPSGRASVVLLRPEERDRIGACRARGFCGYLIKPLRRASLVERVLAAGGKAQSSDDDRVAAPRVEPQPAARGARVLLAEDNPINAMLARALLRREGADVRHVETGEAALAALADEAFDLVLMDVRMPRLSGIDATRSLRARGVETPIVALTANAFDENRRECLAAGMDDFLVKPLSPDALRVALARWTGPGWTPAQRRAKVAS
jgi:CheY-like chemotaxis protein